VIVSLVLSGGLLLAPALASRLDQPAPSTLVAGGDATANLASALEPAGDLAEPSPSEPDPDVGDASTASADDDLPAPSTTTTHVHREPKPLKPVKAVKTVKAAAAPKAAPTAGPPLKRAAPAAPAPKAESKPAAKPQPKPKPESEPGTQAAASEERSPWAGPASPQTEAETLACIRWVETRGDYTAVSPSGQYRGAYQMDDNFWRYYGGDEDLTGRHEQASRAQQDAVATRGLRDRGLAPWPSAVEECA